MLSRVADSIFWMSRYIERAENVARFVDVNQTLSLSFEEGIRTQWEPLVHITGDTQRFAELYGEFNQQNVLQFLTFDTKNPNSILSCVHQARENARSVRETLSTATWQEINKFYLLVRDSAADRSILEQPHRFLSEVKRASNLIIGVTYVTMSHGESWHFCRLGRLLERADKTSRIVDVKYFILLPDPSDVGTPLDVVQWSALLQSTSALEMYRKRHGRIAPSKVADFLILDRHFPRSIHFCVLKSDESLHAITGANEGAFSNRVEQLLGQLKADLDYTHINDIIAQGLHEFIDRFQIRLNQIGDSIDEYFFAPAIHDVASVSPP